MDTIDNLDKKIKKEPLLLQDVLKEVGIAAQESDRVRSEMILRHKILIPQYEKEENRKLIVYIAKIGNQKSAINPDDIAPIGSMLANCGCVENLDLMIHSPGGSGVTAEKIVEMCRNYTKKEFRVIVPNMAKSAATIISLGADKNYVLYPGDTLWVPRGVWHSFKTDTGVIFEEISTTSLETSGDSYYVDKEIAQKPRELRKTKLMNWGRHQFDELPD